MIDSDLESRVNHEFSETQANIIKGLFRDLNVPEHGRVCKIILDRSNGDIDSVYSFIESAKNDYRDVLVAEIGKSSEGLPLPLALILGYLFILLVLLKSWWSHS